MADPTGPIATPARTASAPIFLGTFALVIATIFLLVLFDTALANIDRNETRSRARSEFSAGTRLMAAGRDSEAIAHFRAATELDRDQLDYSVTLAEAMRRISRLSDAEQLLGPILERNATDGAANLAMARILAAEGRVPEAESYYHRAIYGLWPADTGPKRSAARFELIDLLARTGEKQALLAELLPIQDVSPADTILRKRMAHLFVLAGSPARAISIFRDLLRKNPRDADAYLGMGEAALSMTNFPAARMYLREAARLSRGDAGALAKLALADSLLSLDPTQRALSLDEQYRRSRLLLQRTIQSASMCLSPNATEGKVMLDSAAAVLGAPPLGRPRDRDVEANLSLSESLWTLPAGSCAARLRRSDELLSLLQARIQE